MNFENRTPHRTADHFEKWRTAPQALPKIAHRNQNLLHRTALQTSLFASYNGLF